jgi:undecaprenyl-diphosphatase
MMHQEDDLRGKEGYFIAAALFAGVVALGFAVMAGFGHALDVELFGKLALRKNLSPDWAIAAARWASWIGDGERRTLITIGLALWFVWERRFKAALIIAVVPTLGVVVSSALKEAFARPRPHLSPHLDGVYDFAFPSGHAAFGGVFLFAALLLPGKNPRLRIALALLAAGCIGFSRPMLGVHWPSDVIGGWLMGLSIAIASVTLVRNWEGSK